MVRVVVIGAGASGLAAAEKLHKEGVEVLVLEAGERIGGRVHSQDGLELGAQWVHGEQGNALYDLAAKFDMIPEAGDEFSVTDEDELFLWEDDGSQLERRVMEQLQIIFSSIEERVEGKGENWDEGRFSSQGEFFAHYLPVELEQRGLEGDEVANAASAYLEWYSRLQAVIDGSSSWWETKVDQNYEYHECPGNLTLSLKSGASMQGVLENMGGSVLDRVRLNCKVKKVRSQSEERRNFVIETDTNESFLCDYVIITVSLGVLKHEAETLFEPSLPQSKLEVMTNFGFGTIAKVFLGFPVNVTEIRPDMTSSGVNFLRRDCSSPWRNEECQPWQDGVMGLYPTRDNPRMLVAWLSGPAAFKVETLSEPELVEDFCRLLRRFLGPEVPSPVSARVTCWGLNPLTRGSYSFLSLNTLQNSQNLLAEPLGRLLFAGEATHPSFFSSVHGALESGWREAERILSLEKGEK